jgi:homogentisate 1,2-dioxygenase
MTSSDLRYQSGLGNEFATEALAGALPREQNSPQKNPFGLYGEQLTGTSFTALRSVSRWAWTYRIRPAVLHQPFHETSAGLLRSGPFNDAVPTPNQMRWAPMPVPTKPTDFLDGIVTMGGNGDPAMQTGEGWGPRR